MPISPFYREDNYFSQRTRIVSNEIDGQFNNIVNFLNTNILLTLNNLILEQFTGVKNIALQNAFLLNKGDKTTFWNFLSPECFQYKGLNLIKFSLPPFNSILTSDVSGNYAYVSPTGNNQVLRSVLGDVPQFGTLIADCFEDRCILGEHIANGTLTINNFGNNFEFFINAIPGIKFGPNCIIADLIEDSYDDGTGDYGILSDQLTPEVQAVFPSMITSNMMPPGYIKDYFFDIFGGANTYANNIGEYQRFLSPDFFTTPAPFPLEKCFPFDINYFDTNTLLPINIALNSINGQRLQYLNTSGIKPNFMDPNPNDLIMDGAIGPEHLTPQLRQQLGL